MPRSRRDPDGFVKGMQNVEDGEEVGEDDAEMGQARRGEWD